jgi:gliding motility-associated-like protein
LKYFVLICLLYGNSLTAQNLISNPSFEAIDSCYGYPAPIGFDVFDWSGCNGWSIPIKSSIDLWCENPIIGNQSPPYVVGYQMPKHGGNMAGIMVGDPIMLDYREYVQNELTESLLPGKKYRLNFYYSVWAGKASGACPANQLEVFATNSKFNDTSMYWLSHLNPIGSSDPNKFIDDTLNWSSCEIEFTALGGEKYLIIGNFQKNSNASYNYPCDSTGWVDTILIGDYYYLDDFSLYEVPESVTIPNVFSPNKDEVNDTFYPVVVNMNDWKLIIIDRWGNKLEELNRENPFWNGENHSDGVYYYQFYSKNYDIIKHGYFHLIR